MDYPDFFDAAPTIQTRDQLADLLGSYKEGLITYHYVDAVRVCGHSCPTVASAFLMARAALTMLYPEGPAERGNISVVMPAPEEEGTTGVVAQVLTLVTGAAASNGFPGIDGHHARKGLLTYARESGPSKAIQFCRLDTRQSVAVQVDLEVVPPDPQMQASIRQAFSGKLAPSEQRQFSNAWQGRVRQLFSEFADNPALMRVEALESA
jgi:hypothetical protein